MNGTRSASEGRIAWLRYACIAGAVLVGLLDTWFYRSWNLNPDGVSYLDLARAFLAHGPAALVNGYWSPLYPAAIGAALAVASPEGDAMYAVVRTVGLVVYFVTIASYDRFVRIVMARVEMTGVLPAAFLVSAWALFFLFVSQAIGLHLATPDMGVAAMVFFVAAELLALGAGPWTQSRWILLGVVFGIGYWWKAILFPVSGVAWLLAAALAFRRRDGWRGPAAAAVTFGALALVVAIPVTRAVGRLTFGETGRVNQLWFVSNVPNVALLCLPPGEKVQMAGIGTVPTIPVLTTSPLTCAMRDATAEATLPVWYDPSPWYRETSNRVDPAEIVAAVRSDDGEVLLALDSLAPLSAIAIIAVLGGALVAALIGVRAPWRRTSAGEDAGGFMTMALFGAAPILAYVTVYVELRHIVPFILCLVLWALSTLMAGFRRAGIAALVVILLATVADSAMRAGRQQRVEAAITVHELGGAPRGVQESSAVAEALRARGYRPGERMAAVNAMWNADWAQRGGFVVRAYVPQFTYPIGRAVAELSDRCLRGAYVAALRGEGIRALVLRKAPGVPVPFGFFAIEGTRYHVLDMSTAEARPPGCRA